MTNTSQRYQELSRYFASEWGNPNMPSENLTWEKIYQIFDAFLQEVAEKKIDINTFTDFCEKIDWIVMMYFKNSTRRQLELSEFFLYSDDGSNPITQKDIDQLVKDYNSWKKINSLKDISKDDSFRFTEKLTQFGKKQLSLIHHHKGAKITAKEIRDLFSSLITDLLSEKIDIFEFERLAFDIYFFRWDLVEGDPLDKSLEKLLKESIEVSKNGNEAELIKDLKKYKSTITTQTN